MIVLCMSSILHCMPRNSILLLETSSNLAFYSCYGLNIIHIIIMQRMSCTKKLIHRFICIIRMIRRELDIKKYEAIPRIESTSNAVGNLFVSSYVSFVALASIATKTRTTKVRCCRQNKYMQHPDPSYQNLCTMVKYLERVVLKRSHEVLKSSLVGGASLYKLSSSSKHSKTSISNFLSLKTSETISL